MNRDKLNNVPLRRAANAAMAIIDRAQNIEEGAREAGIAAAFLLLCEHWGTSPQDVFAATTNIMNHADGRRPEFKAVAQYLAEECR